MKYVVIFVALSILNLTPNILWAKPNKAELKKSLTELQYKVTQEDATEPPFKNKYWDNKAEGIYVDIVSGEALFSSTHKYKSGTGWPSFTRPLVSKNIVEKEDRKLFTTRTEVRSSKGDSHLGHVFKDGPKPTGLRYCINSAALRFIPKKDMAKDGYGNFLKLFAKGKVKKNTKYQKITVAGGCFWCTESDFESQKGVVEAVSGYAGGREKNPSYKRVSTGKTGHTEVVQITFDPRVTSAKKLLNYFWLTIDPTVENRQFCDKGSQYRTAIFYHDKTQKKIAEKGKLWAGKKLKTKIYTEIVPMKKFWEAEDYHQDYYKLNPVRYKYYRYSCGREARLEELWGGK